jgi:sugar phosphate isomerase/epimerase
MMDFSVASYSFHRQLEAGQHDMFKYIADSKALGCTTLDIWNEHLQPLIHETKEFVGGRNTLRLHFSPAGVKYAEDVRKAIDESGLGVACLTLDGAHIWEESGPARDINRVAARRWLDIAEILGAKTVRIDSGGTPEMPDEQFQIIVKGCNDFIARAREKGVGVLMENHWGASKVPANIVRILQAVPDLGLLFDSGNWAAGTQEEGWQTCVEYAKAVHIKTRVFDAEGNDITSNIPRIVRMLVEAGYKGVWSVECIATEGDEFTNAQKSLDLVKRSLKAVGA